MNRNHHHCLEVYHNRVEWIVMMEDLHQSLQSYSFNTFKYCSRGLMKNFITKVNRLQIGEIKKVNIKGHYYLEV